MNGRNKDSRPAWQWRLMKKRATKQFLKLRPDLASLVGPMITVIASEEDDDHQHMPIFVGSPVPYRIYVWMVTDGRKYHCYGWAKGNNKGWEQFWSQRLGHENNYWIHRNRLSPLEDLNAHSVQDRRR